MQILLLRYVGLPPSERRQKRPVPKNRLWYFVSCNRVVVVPGSDNIFLIVVYSQKNQFMFNMFNYSVIYGNSTQETGEHEQPDTPLFQHRTFFISGLTW